TADIIEQQCQATAGTAVCALAKTSYPSIYQNVADTLRLNFGGISILQNGKTTPIVGAGPAGEWTRDTTRALYTGGDVSSVTLDFTPFAAQCAACAGMTTPGCDFCNACAAIGGMAPFCNFTAPYTAVLPTGAGAKFTLPAVPMLAQLLDAAPNVGRQI